MPQQADVTLNDGAGTPVGHVFKAAGVDGKGVATYYEKTTSSLVSGFFRLTYFTRLSTKLTEPNRHSMKLVLPTVVTETINGVTYNKVARQSMLSVDCIVAPDSTAQERKDLCAYSADALTFSGANTFGYTIVNQEAVV